jgi:RNA polymerase-binding protein DksA
MTTHDLESFRRLLREMAGRLSGDVAELRDKALRPTGEGASASAADAEAVNREGEEEVALAMLGVEGDILGEIDAALARIDQGTFGRCSTCGRPISRTRLDALPYARLCIVCARREEEEAAKS